MRGFGRTGVIDRMFLEILRHGFSLVEHLLDAGVGDIARHDQRAFSRTGRTARSGRESGGRGGALCLRHRSLCCHIPMQIRDHAALGPELAGIEGDTPLGPEVS